MRVQIGLCAVFAVLLAGCGSSSKKKPTVSAAEAQVRSVVVRFGQATAVKDYQEICDDLISKQLSDNVEEFGLPCELAFRQGIDKAVDPKLVIRSVKVIGSTAEVVVHSTAANQPPSDDTLELTKLPTQGWRITALGSAPKEKPKPVKTPAKKK